MIARFSIKTIMQLQYFLMVMFCLECTYSSLRIEAAFKNISSWSSDSSNSGFENISGIFIRMLVVSSYLALSSFSYKIEVLYETVICYAYLSDFLNLLLALLTMKLLLLLSSGS